MTYKDTVKHLLTEYPLLFKNKISVDDYLFSNNGNGYKWINGELVDVAESHTQPISQEEAMTNFVKGMLPTNQLWDLFKMFKKKPMIQGKDFFTNILEEQKEQILEGIYNIFNVEKHSTDTFCNWLITIYLDSPLRTIPEDINDDWKVAIIEFIDWCIINNKRVFIEGIENKVEWFQDLKAKLCSDR